MRPRQPKTLQELQDEAALTSQILGTVNDFGRNNSSHYASEKAKDDPQEFYYTDDQPFMRNENYTVNGEPVSKFMGKKNG